MIDFIQGKTKKIMYDCMKNYADKRNRNPLDEAVNGNTSVIKISDVQLVLGLNENGNTYTLCEQYVPKKEMTFLEVLGVKIDFLGYSLFAPPFILKSLVRFSETYGFPVENSKVMCVPTLNDNNKPDVLLFVYNENEYVDTITFQDLFREEDMEIPT